MGVADLAKAGDGSAPPVPAAGGVFQCTDIW